MNQTHASIRWFMVTWQRLNLNVEQCNSWLLEIPLKSKFNCFSRYQWLSVYYKVHSCRQLTAYWIKLTMWQDFYLHNSIILQGVQLSKLCCLFNEKYHCMYIYTYMVRHQSPFTLSTWMLRTPTWQHMHYIVSGFLYTSQYLTGSTVACNWG